MFLTKFHQNPIINEDFEIIWERWGGRAGEGVLFKPSFFSEKKEWPFQCNVLLKQIDQKKGRPTNHSEHAYWIQQLTSVFVSIRTIIKTVCFMYDLFIMKLLEKDRYYTYPIICKYIYINNSAYTSYCQLLHYIVVHFSYICMFE